MLRQGQEMSSLGSICKPMREQSFIHEQDVQANMRSLQQPRGQPFQPSGFALGLKCYLRWSMPLSTVRDCDFSDPPYEKLGLKDSKIFFILCILKNDI